MVQLQVNNEQLNYNQKDTSTLNEVIDHVFESQENEDDFVLTNVFVDGKPVTEDKEEEILNSNINAYKNINIVLTKKIELANQALSSSSKYIDEIISDIMVISDHYQKNEFDLANKKFSSTMELIDLFVKLISNVCRTISKNDKDSEVYKTIQEQEIHLLSVLKTMLPAKEKEDIIMLCDLLEYELVDNLTKWKIEVIPNLKKLTQV